ncbi:MAG: hypothetical protein LKF69_04515 [Bacilli bacterium]|jgi:hypothetical protein|nr:hypothetical protein [Bacilli bacterium]
MKRKNESDVGTIYYVDPRHLVEPKNWPNYVKTKGVKASNSRPVAVVKTAPQYAQISEITSKATTKQIANKQRVPLTKTYSNRKKDSYINTEVVSKSQLTNNRFKVGKHPLDAVNKAKKRVHPDDLKEYYKARKSRGWK